MKTGHIISEGSWQAFEFLKDNRISEELKQQPEWRSLATVLPEITAEVPGRIPNITNISAMLSKGEKPLHRREFETIIKKSRSTANRILEKWIKEGLIKKVGNARNTRYFIIKPLTHALKEEFLT